MTWFKRIILIVIALIILVPLSGFIALQLLDLNAFKPKITAAVYDKLGRELVIDGDISAGIGLSPTVQVSGVRLSNPEWATSDDMLSIEDVEVTLELLPLLDKHIVIDELMLGSVKVELEASDKRKNWQFKSPKAEAGSDDAAVEEDVSEAAEKEGGFTPEIHLVNLQDVTIVYRDGKRDEPLKAHIPAIVMHTSEAVDVSAEIEAKPFKAQVVVQAPSLQAVERGDITINVNAEAPQGTRLVAEGKVNKLTSSPEISMMVEAKGSSFEPYAALMGSSMPDFGDYAFAGKLEGEPDNIAISDLNLTLLDSVITGRSHVNLQGKVPYITASLQTETFDMRSLPSGGGGSAAAPASGDAPAAATPSGRVIPNAPIAIPSLTSVNADIDWSIKTLKTEAHTFENVLGNTVLKAGILQLSPMQFKWKDELVKASVILSTNVTPPALSVSVQSNGSNLGAILKELNVDGELRGGAYQADIALKGQGKDVYQLIRTLNGSLSLFIDKSNYISDKTSKFSNIVNALKAGATNEDININCVVSKFAMKNGVMTPDYLIADTSKVRVHGEGSIDMPQELLGMAFYPEVKDMAYAELSVPVKVKGTFAKPDIKADKTQAALSITKAFVDSDKLKGVESLLGKGTPKSVSRDVSKIHPCLKPIKVEGAAEGEEAPALKDTVTEKKEKGKEKIKDIEKDIRGFRDGIKKLF